MLEANGIDWKAVLSAVNAVMGQCELDSPGIPKTGKGSIKGKQIPIYTVSVSQTDKYRGDGTSIPLAFDYWEGKMSAVQAIASVELTKLPARFEAWLKKFPVKVEKTEAELKADADAVKAVKAVKAVPA